MFGNLKDLTLRRNLKNHSGTNLKNDLGDGSGGPGVGFRTGRSSGKPLLLPVLKKQPPAPPKPTPGPPEPPPNFCLART